MEYFQGYKGRLTKYKQVMKIGVKLIYNFK